MHPRQPGIESRCAASGAGLRPRVDAALYVLPVAQPNPVVLAGYAPVVDGSYPGGGIETLAPSSLDPTRRLVADFATRLAAA